MVGCGGSALSHELQQAGRLNPPCEPRIQCDREPLHQAKGHTMKVGFIGLGRMGQAMARRILDGGHELAVYNRTPDKVRALGDSGARIVGSVAEVTCYGEAVFTMLADDA